MHLVESGGFYLGRRISKAYQTIDRPIQLHRTRHAQIAAAVMAWSQSKENLW